MKKAQESAPIEVLIGVTILTFVLIIAMHLFQNSCSSQYEQKLDAGFSKFARDLEFTYMGAVGTSMSTSLDLTTPQGCNSVHIKSIVLKQGSPATCKARLGKPSCMILSALLVPDNPSASSTNLFLTTEVVDIPSDITVSNYVGGCKGKDLNGGNSIDDLINDNCTFMPTYYSFTLNKTSSNEISIS